MVDLIDISSIIGVSSRIMVIYNRYFIYIAIISSVALQ